MNTPASTDKDLWVSWDEYNRMVERLALQVYESNWKFDMVLCLARGGVRPGDVISRIFDVPLAILSTSSYREEAGTKQGNLDIAKYMTMTKGPLAGRILLVDDLADTGVTLQKVGEHLKTNYPDVTEVRSAVIWVKGTSYGEHREVYLWVTHCPESMSASFHSVVKAERTFSQCPLGRLVKFS